MSCNLEANLPAICSWVFLHKLFNLYLISLYLSFLIWRMTSYTYSDLCELTEKKMHKITSTGPHTLYEWNQSQLSIVIVDVVVVFTNDVIIAWRPKCFRLTVINFNFIILQKYFHYLSYYQSILNIYNLKQYFVL